MWKCSESTINIWVWMKHSCFTHAGIMYTALHNYKIDWLTTPFGEHWVQEIYCPWHVGVCGNKKANSLASRAQITWKQNGQKTHSVGNKGHCDMVWHNQWGNILVTAVGVADWVWHEMQWLQTGDIPVNNITSHNCYRQWFLTKKPFKAFSWWRNLWS